jgi:hypothetical protein
MARLKLASDVDEINAAFDKVYPELLGLAHYYAGMVHVPFVDVEGMIKQQMQTPQFKLQAIKIIDDALEAAEAVRDAKAKPAA